MEIPLGQYEELGGEIGRLVDRKNRAYGDSFARTGDVIAIMAPGGVGRVILADLLAVIRIIDKLFRIMTARDALGEDPWMDIAGYALLRCRQIRKEKADKQKGDGS